MQWNSASQFFILHLDFHTHDVTKFMNRFLLVVSFVVLLSSCSKTDKPEAGNDSLLVKPMNVDPVQEAQAPNDTITGLLIDRTRLRTPEHEALLQRFEPLEVVRIFHAFKEIRKPGIKQEQVEKFIAEKKITADELKAILEEGDRLGWSKK